MKQSLILLTLVLTFFSCTVKEKPVFEKIEAIKLLSSTSDVITVSANAFFKNPNDLGGVLKTDDIKVYVNSNQVASIASEEFDVPRQDTFKIPLTAIIHVKKLTKEFNIGNLLGSLLSQKIQIQYKGQLQYKVLGFSSTYDIDQTQDIKVKL